MGATRANICQDARRYSKPLCGFSWRFTPWCGGNEAEQQPPGLSRETEKSPELRMTLLVNYWDRRPIPPNCRDYDGTVYNSLQIGKDELVRKNLHSKAT